MSESGSPSINVPDIAWYGAKGGTRLVLAHGAGAGRNSPFMTAFAEGLASRDLRTGLFDFPYMAGIQRAGRRRPPDPVPTLRASWNAVIDVAGPEMLIIGGKSIGGRIASLVADQRRVAGLVCLGFPFHAPGRPPGTRTDHLRSLTTPTLICQGERDPFGTRAEIAGYRLSQAIRFTWLPDGDHSFKPRRKSGLTDAENIETALDAVADFVREHTC